MIEAKDFFFPIHIVDLLLIKPETMNKERELDFEQRKINMEKEALKEEKSRYLNGLYSKFEFIFKELKKKRMKNLLKKILILKEKLKIYQYLRNLSNLSLRVH